MKKILVFLCALSFLFGLVGTASAESFTDTKTLGVTLAEGPIAGIFYPSSYSYSHDTPANFGVPPDKVNSATLDISGYWIDGNDDGVAVDGGATGYLNEGGSQGDFWIWNWDTPSVTSFDIADIFVSWIAGDKLGVTINANGGCGDWKLELASSTFRLDYTDNGEVSGGAVPVTEPATMLLFGFGLIGLASFGKKSFFRKAFGSGA